MNINTTHYKFVTGKSPKGYGTWFFEIGDKEVSFTGTYSDVKKQVIPLAKEKKLTSVKLLS